MPDHLTLPASTYQAPSRADVAEAADDGILLPFALDPNPAPGPSPLSKSRNLGEQSSEPLQPRTIDARGDRDYFNRTAGNHRDMLKENRSRSASGERPPKSPHIAYQEKGRQPSDHMVDTLRKRNEPAAESPAHDRSRSQLASPAGSQSTEAFKLQDVPKNKKAEARKNERSQSSSPVDANGRLISPRDPSLTSSPMPADVQSPHDDSPVTSGSSYGSAPQFQRPARGDSLVPARGDSLAPARGDSLAHSNVKANLPRKDIPSASPTTPTIAYPERTSSGAHANGQYNMTGQVESPQQRYPEPPMRSAGRPGPSSDNYTSPRMPPHPPPPQPHKASESVSTLQSDMSYPSHPTPGLPRYSAQGDFSMDEDFARLLSGQEQEKEGGVLRRVSNAMSKHGRSFSDRGSVTGRGHKKWPTNGSIDISSPTMAAPESKEEWINLRNELRRAHQRIAELEAEKNGLQETVHNVAEIKQANTMLREKRNTMAVLDTQREMVIRELEIMTEHLQRAKESNQQLDYNALKSDITKDFATSLHKLRDQLGGQIEELISKRIELTNEISNLIQMKDKGFQEYESLSATNTKLSAMNRDLLEQVQKVMKDHKHAGGKSIDIGQSSANGLGIYQTHHKGGKSDISIDIHNLAHEPSYSNLHDAETEATVAQPKVVNISKTGKANKFNWKKGGQAITKNVTKGFKGAFGERREEELKNVGTIGTPYGSTHSQPDFASMASAAPPLPTRPKEEPQQRGWFGGKQQANKGQPERLRNMQNNSSSNLLGENSSVLFGSDLTARCEFEKRMIPAIVSRCVEEVELRGMDVEGIYRKSGASSQVTQVRNGFEKSNEYDISDPDLDIHAVTSALKNYFRRLPVPLITFDVYDQFLEAGRKYIVSRSQKQLADILSSEIEEPEKKTKALVAAINEIPRTHRDCLQFLVFHLSRVIQHANVNLVSSTFLICYLGRQWLTTP